MTERVSVTDSGVDVADDVRDGYLDRVVTRTLTWIALTLVSCVVWFAIAVCSGWAVNLPVVVGLTCAGLLGSHLMVRRAPHVRGTWLDALLVIGLQGLAFACLVVALGTLLARGHRTSREIPASRPTEAAILLTDGILNVYFALMVVGLPI